jgi:hypothetical protein
MYSIHNIVKDETQTQLAEEQPTDMMCMFDDISYLDNLPKYDQYDDDYVVEIDVDCSKKPTACFWEKEAQLQIKYDNQPLHNNYDNNEENATNLRVSERSMPLCFSSFQFLRENYKQIVNSRDGECSDESVGDVIDDIEVVLDPNLQPLSYIDLQTEDELMHYNSIPLTFNSFQFLKKIFNHVMDDKHTENQEFVLEPIKQSSQSMQDPIADVLDDLCCQSHGSFSSYELKSSYDIDMIRQSLSWSVSAGVSFQSSTENLQPYQELYNDVKIICVIPNYDHKFVESQEIGRVFPDPIADYMEDFFSIKDQSCFQQWPLHFAVLILWTKGQVVLLIVLTSSQAIHLFQQAT